MTQKQRLLNALKSETITTYQAVVALGILCPWKRVQELKADGHQIRSEFFYRETQDGRKRIVRYVLDPQSRLPI